MRWCCSRKFKIYWYVKLCIFVFFHTTIRSVLWTYLFLAN
jgi:hypothetical protein